ncbi:hypothetical protein K432DRAFT_394440 [Lepidopterella palustris CBS 459.81]|uniref:Uncharacterized protein n=1 Tax=Lepidopterella palustris CBS 459.81 TaxID=1314670 RepID=A0A8E2E7M4_9PEZI|nr:hypothetical protein K432DRAFT_394440 [Lepidopterella palustris CBS 459.81]
MEMVHMISKCSQPNRFKDSSTRHPLGRVRCATCKEPASQKSTFSKNALTRLKKNDYMISVSAGRHLTSIFGHVCCRSGRSWKRTPEKMGHPSRSFLQTVRDTVQETIGRQPKPRESFVLRFVRPDEACSCTHRCCVHCLEFQLPGDEKENEWLIGYVHTADAAASLPKVTQELRREALRH